MKQKIEHGIITRCREAAFDAITDAKRMHEDDAQVKVKCNSGEIWICIYKHDAYVEIYNESDGECPNLTNAIMEAIPEWYDVPDDFDDDNDYYL